MRPVVCSRKVTEIGSRIRSHNTVVARSAILLCYPFLQGKANSRLPRNFIFSRLLPPLRYPERAIGIPLVSYQWLSQVEPPSRAGREILFFK